MFAPNITLDEENQVGKLNVSRSSGAVVSPDGKQVAFVNRGEIFVTSVEYPTTSSRNLRCVPDKSTRQAPCVLSWYQRSLS